MKKRYTPRIKPTLTAAAASHVLRQEGLIKAEENRQLEKAEYLNTNQVWSELAALAQHCSGLLQTYAALPQLLKDTGLATKLTNPRQFANNVMVLTKDLKSLHEELTIIRLAHMEDDPENPGQKRYIQGGVRTGDDHVFVLELFEKYMHWNQRHAALVVPNWTGISEQVRQAEHVMREDLREKEGDAAVKEFDHANHQKVRGTHGVVQEADLGMNPGTGEPVQGLAPQPAADVTAEQPVSGETTPQT